eukprot:1156605-Pelagomonas_calceolata.AAC.2
MIPVCRWLSLEINHFNFEEFGSLQFKLEWCAVHSKQRQKAWHALLVQRGAGPLPGLVGRRKGGQCPQQLQCKMRANAWRMHAATHTVLHPAMHASFHAVMHAAIHAATHAAMRTAMHAATHAVMHAAMHAETHAVMHAAMHAATHAAMRTAMHAAMHAAMHTAMHAALHAAMHAAMHATLILHSRLHVHHGILYCLG